MGEDSGVPRVRFGPGGRRMALRAFGTAGIGAFAVACGGESAPAAKPAEPTKAPVAAAPTTAPPAPTKAPAPAADPVTGKLSVMASPQQDWIDAQVNAFKKASSIDTTQG